MKKYDITVILPGIKPEGWSEIYNSVVESVGNHSFEFIGIGPYTPEDKLLQKDNFVFLKDFGHPSRCLQHATTIAKGKFMTWGSEDGIFQPEALSNCIKLLQEKNREDGITIRYFEQDIHNDAPQPNQEKLWNAHYHRDLQLPGVAVDYKIANIAMYYLDYYKEVGGIDCRFEHVNMNCNDLAFRIQAAGGKIYPSPDIVIKQTNISTKNESVHRLPIGMTIKKTPKEGLPAIERAYHENDYPLFYDIYSKTGAAHERIKIDYDNWKFASEVWERRFTNVDIITAELSQVKISLKNSLKELTYKGLLSDVECDKIIQNLMS